MLRVLYVLTLIVLRLIFIVLVFTASCAEPAERVLWVEDCLYYFDPAYSGSVPHAPQCGDPEALGMMVR